MGYYKFEKLEVWKLSRQFLKTIYKITKDFPNAERFGLTSQTNRAALSIMLNIAEGCDRGSDKDFVRFLRMAYSSLLETISCCYAALDQEYMSNARFEFTYNTSHKLAKKINALIRYLSKEVLT